MKKSLFIILGALILILLVGVWVYLLFFGTPKDTGEIFANLGFTSERDRTPVATEDEMIATTTVEAKPLPKQALRQLTFRPVAGVFVLDILFPKTVRFVERGTGHIFEIDLATGVETTVTQHTVPQTAEAIFAPDGSSVVHTSFVDGTRTSIVSVLSTTTGSTAEVVKSLPLPPGAGNFAYSDADTLLYTMSSSNETTGYQFSISSQTRAEMFRTPLTQVTMVWGNGLDKAYLYTKPSQYLEGYVYEVASGAKLKRIRKGANGLMYTRNNVLEVFTTADLKEIKSTYAYAGKDIPAPLPFLPEKCDFVDIDAATYWCAANTELIDPSFPEAWYAGLKISDDGLWQINAETGVADERIKFKAVSGRVVDVASIYATEDGFSVFFINKLDSTLWLYDTLADIAATSN